jgi:2-methylcitrate synthase
MSDSPSTDPTFKPKKSVALSGVVAGNTALCTVGRTGNDLQLPRLRHPGDRRDLRIRGNRLPADSRRSAESQRARALQGEAQAPCVRCPAVRTVLEAIGRRRTRWTCCAPASRRSAAAFPEKDDHTAPAGARDIADRLIASQGSMLTYWYHFQPTRPAHRGRDRRRFVGGHFCTCCTAARPSASWVRAMHTSLILYAEHEFNASTFTARVIAGTGSDLYSCITGAIGALRGPKHGGANEVAFEIQQRYADPDEAEATSAPRREKEVIIGFGHPVYTIADPRNQGHQGGRPPPGRGKPAIRATSRSPSASRR